MDQFLGFTGIVHNQSVQVLGTSNLEFGLSERLASFVLLLVNLNSGDFDVVPPGQFQKLLDVGDFLSHFQL